MTHIFAHQITGFTLAGDAAKAGIVASSQYLPTGGRFDDGGAFLLSDVAHTVDKAIDAEEDLFVQASYEMTELGFDTKLLELRNNTGASVALSLYVSSKGQLYILDANGAEVGRTATDTMGWNDPHTICVQCVDAGESDASVTLYIDDRTLPLLTLTDVDMVGGGGGIDLLRWQVSAGGSRAFKLCQLLVFSDASSGAGDQLTAYIRGSRLYTLLPVSDDSVEWTRSAGAVNADLVDDTLSAASDEDGTYVEATADNKLDLYECEDLPASAESAYGVVLYMEHKHITTGDIIRLAMKSYDDAEEFDSSNIATTAAYLEGQAFFRRAKPSAGEDWTPARVNGMKFGPKIPLSA